MLSNPPHRRRLLEYFVAVLAAVGGLLLRIPIYPILGNQLPFITFFLATAISAFFGGFTPGLITTILGAAFTALYFLPPVGSLSVDEPAGMLGLLLFFVEGAALSLLGARLRESRSAETALRLSFQQTLLGIGDAVISTDAERRIRLMNRAAEELTGWSHQDAEHRPIDEVFRIVREGSDDPVEVPIDRVLATGRVVGLANHTELLSKDGRRTPIDDSGSPVLGPNGEIVGAVLVFRDVTQQREAQRQIAAAATRAKNILASIREAFFLLDPKWIFVEISPEGEKALRASPQELLGKSFWTVYPGLIGTELERRYRAAMQENVPQHFEFFSPVSQRWVDIHAYPSEEGLAVYFRDISQRKREEADLRRLNEDLRQFTYAASHDLREPIRMVTIYSERLEQELAGDLPGDAARFLSYIVSGAQRISRLVDGLLHFSRVGDMPAPLGVVCDADGALQESLASLEFLTRQAGAEITSASLPNVAADAAHLSQIFQNLITNAVKYAVPGTAPVVRISATLEQGRCIFAVGDNGSGIAREFQEQIFQPLKRLHGPEIPGAGIGLAICKRIVEHYGGRIWVESEGVGRGSTFYFTLPAASASATA